MPNVIVSGDSLEISCCCEEFKKKLLAVAKDDTNRQVKQSIESRLSSAIKGFR